LNQARHRAASQPQPPPSSMWPIPLYSSIDDVYYAPAYQIQSQHLVFPSDVSNLQPLTYDQDMAWMISNTETPTGNQIQTMS
jgi:hypothetical protein